MEGLKRAFVQSVKRGCVETPFYTLSIERVIKNAGNLNSRFCLFVALGDVIFSNVFSLCFSCSIMFNN